MLCGGACIGDRHQTTSYCNIWCLVCVCGMTCLHRSQTCACVCQAVLSLRLPRILDSLDCKCVLARSPRYAQSATAHSLTRSTTDTLPRYRHRHRDIMVHVCASMAVRNLTTMCCVLCRWCRRSAWRYVSVDLARTGQPQIQACNPVIVAKPLPVSLTALLFLTSSLE